jgi:hypothetical protein
VIGVPLLIILFGVTHLTRRWRRSHA